MSPVPANPVAEALAELQRTPVHTLSVDAVGEVLRALVLGAHPGVEVLVERAVARAHQVEPWRGLQFLGLEAEASRFAPGCASARLPQLRELSEIAGAAARAQRTPRPPLDAAALARLADLDAVELARVDALATAQGLTRPTMLARLLAIGSGAVAANDANSLANTTTKDQRFLGGGEHPTSAPVCATAATSPSPWSPGSPGRSARSIKGGSK